MLLSRNRKIDMSEPRKYLYTRHEGVLYRADVIGGICELVQFDSPIRSGSILKVVPSSDPSMTIEQFESKLATESFSITAA